VVSKSAFSETGLLPSHEDGGSSFIFPQMLRSGRLFWTRCFGLMVGNLRCVFGRLSHDSYSANDDDVQHADSR